MRGRSDDVRVEVRVLEYRLRLARELVHRRRQTPVQAFVQRRHVVEMQRAAFGPQVHVVRLHLAHAPHGRLLVRFARVHSFPDDVLRDEKKKKIKTIIIIVTTCNDNARRTFVSPSSVSAFYCCADTTPKRASRSERNTYLRKVFQSDNAIVL